jgi:hypothetical protein
MPGRSSEEAVETRGCTSGQQGCKRQSGAASCAWCDAVGKEEGRKAGGLILFFWRNSRADRKWVVGLASRPHQRYVRGRTDARFLTLPYYNSKDIRA